MNESLSPVKTGGRLFQVPRLFGGHAELSVNYDILNKGNIFSLHRKDPASDF